MLPFPHMAVSSATRDREGHWKLRPFTARSEGEALQALSSQGDSGRTSSILPESFNCPSLQILHFSLAFREIRTPCLQAQCFTREGQRFGARERGAGSPVPGLRPSLLDNRKFLSGLRIANAGYVLSVERDLLVPWELWVWPVGKC